MIIQIRNTFILIVAIAAAYVTLKFLSYNFILTIGLLVLAAHIGDFVVKILWNSLPSPILNDLQDKNVLITGCDTGFGNKLARQLDAKGVTVFACCLFAEGPNALQLKKECSKNLHIIQLDVTKEDQVKTAVAIVKKKLSGKKLWAVVNNAGVGLGCDAALTSIETVMKVLDVNTLGVARVTQAFLPMLKESKGRIVVVASVAGIVSAPFMSAYSMSKHAIVAYSEALRRELVKFSITVHTINPMGYKTDIVNLETNLRNTYKEWEQASEDLKDLYEADHYIELKNIFDFANTSILGPKSNIQEPIDCLIDAVIGKYPKLHYFTGLDGKLYVWLIHRVPLEVMDFVFFIFLFIAKIIKGKPTSNKDK